MLTLEGVPFAYGIIVMLGALWWSLSQPVWIQPVSSWASPPEKELLAFRHTVLEGEQY